MPIACTAGGRPAGRPFRGPAKNGEGVGHQNRDQRLDRALVRTGRSPGRHVPSCRDMTRDGSHSVGVNSDPPAAAVLATIKDKEQVTVVDAGHQPPLSIRVFEYDFTAQATCRPTTTRHRSTDLQGGPNRPRRYRAGRHRSPHQRSPPLADELDDLVRQARAQGASWTKLALVLGIEPPGPTRGTGTSPPARSINAH